MSTHVKVMTSIERDRAGMRGVGVVVTTSNATVGHWRQVAEDAAGALWKMTPGRDEGSVERTLERALERVLFKFDVETFTQELVDQAREAFTARWLALAAGEVAP